MTINFNFKKYLKYIFLALLCYILFNSFTNVKAWTDLSSDYIVNYTNDDNSNIASFLIKGDTNDFNNLLITEFNNNDFNSYYDSVKSVVATQLGYASWELFTNDYYYITDLWFVPNSNFTSGSISINFYWCKKDSANASLFNLSMATTTRSSSTPTINTNLTYWTQFGAIYRQGNGLHFTRSINDFYLGAGNRYYNWDYGLLGFIKECKSSNIGCNVRDYDSSTKTLTINFSDNNGDFIHYVDSNKEQLNLYFAKVNAFLQNTDYLFQKAILNDNSSNIYNLVEPIATNVLSKLIIIPENVQQLSNNALGVTVNTVSNTLTGFYTNPTYSTFCSNQRPFVNKVCNIYASDILEQDRVNSNYINEIGFYFNKNEISFQGNYKVVTFRLYTPYNLKILDSFYTTNSTGNSLIPFTIISQQLVDYSLYREYVVVLQPDSSTVSTDQLTSLHFSFSYLSDFVSEIPADYSFGVYNTIKFSSYNDTPTASDIEQEINNNPLSSISNNDSNSFFSNFNINDRGLSQFILLPLTYLGNFKNTTCSSITLPIPHINNFSLPCVSSFMNSNVPTIWTLYKLLINGFIIYRLVISLFGDLKNIYKPENDRIEVLDL